jgi:hypothetical protein
LRNFRAIECVLRSQTVVIGEDDIDAVGSNVAVAAYWMVIDGHVAAF